ncbi:MAG: hypothetical protein AAF490_02985 [Chloroflexota bacterium]
MMDKEFYGLEDVEMFKDQEKELKADQSNGLAGLLIGIVAVLVVAFLLINPFGSNANEAAPTAIMPTFQIEMVSTPTLAPTERITVAPSPTAADTSPPTIEATETAVATQTPLPTQTQPATYTPEATHTSLPTQTPLPTQTIPPSYTPQATFTPIPTFTPLPTATAVPALTAGDRVQNTLLDFIESPQLPTLAIIALLVGASLIVFAIFKGQLDAFYERQLRAVIQEMLGPIYELIDPLIRLYWNIETPIEETIVLGESEPVHKVVSPPKHHPSGGGDLPEVAPVQTPDEPDTPLNTGAEPVSDEETPVQAPVQNSVNSINVSIKPNDEKDERLMRKICSIWERLPKKSLNQFFKSKSVFSKNPVNSAITKRALLWGLQNDLVTNSPELERAIGKGNKQ